MNLKKILLFSFCLYGFESKAQDSILNEKLLINTTVGVGALGSLIALNQVWYSEYQTQKFHFFNDGSNWMQMDKCGHSFTAYALSMELSSVYCHAYGNKGKYIGAGISFAYLGTLEVMDGFSSGWGFSAYDLAANSLGIGLSLLQDRNEIMFLPKFSFYPSSYSKFRPEVLGNNILQNVLKDYNSQTYWISFPINHFSILPKKFDFLCLSLGYSVDQKLVGNDDHYLDFHAQREFVFSLDVDLSKVARNKPKLNKVLSHLNYIKIPCSALLFSKGNLSFKPIYL